MTSGGPLEIVDGRPAVRVDEAEYIRLLGFPRGHTLDGRSLELAEWARAWYAAHGRPWVYARQCRTLTTAAGTVHVDDVTFRSERLRRTLDQAGAHGVVVVAVSAGDEVERQAQQAWREEKPDEYFFLEMFGSAVVEHLTTMTGARLCAWADRESMAVLPHYSPGYPDWDIVDQSSLFSLVGPATLPGSLEVLESGMLRPKKSQLAVFGLTRHTERVRRLAGLVPCEQCSYGGCQYRRAPYARGALFAGTAADGTAASRSAPAYHLSTRALRRWADERLSITATAEGGVQALFRYDGTTCSNTGRSLTFHYRVTLGPRGEGFPIRDQACVPAPGDEGHQAMCEYLREGPGLLETIARDKPLIGRPLDAVLSWPRPSIGPGCYCQSDARQHKWGLVLETIHYALSQNGGPR
jgi:hypothetical protein